MLLTKNSKGSIVMLQIRLHYNKVPRIFILVLTSDLMRLHSNSNIAISVVTLVVLSSLQVQLENFRLFFLGVVCFFNVIQSNQLV